MATEQDEKQDQQQTEDYDAVWAELDKAEGVAPTADIDDDQDGLPEKSDPGTGAKEGNSADDPGATASKDSRPVEKPQPVEDQTEKRIKDLQAGFTRMAQENSELKRLLQERDAGNATDKQVKDQQQKVDAAKAAIDQGAMDAVYKEFPELKGVLEPLLQTVSTLQNETQSVRKELEDRDAKARQNAEFEKKKKDLEEFESKVKPKITAVHPDFDDILSNDEYWKWADKQRPSLKVAAFLSTDPEDINWAISEFKKANALPSAQALKTQDKDRRETKLQQQMSMRGGSTPLPSSGKNKDPNDYDGAWDEAEKEERRQGR